MFKIIFLIFSIILNIYLIFLVFNKSLTVSYTQDQNKYFQKSIDNSEILIFELTKNKSYDEIENFALKMKNKSYLAKKTKKGYIIEPYEFIFNTTNKLIKVIYIE